MKRRLATAKTAPSTRREASALDEHEIQRRASPEIVTVQRRGDQVTFEPKAIAAQLGVKPEHVKVRKDRYGAIFVDVYRQMADARFGWWEEYSAELLS